MRNLTFVDQLFIAADNALRTLHGGYQTTERENPAELVDDVELDEKQRKHVSGLMRINHCGEVCAQALYQGQALTAKLPEVRASMERAAEEENDHLAWCADRLQQLGSHPSVLNPLWYVGSFTIGAVAGVLGDDWSLGFVAETEHQVVRHLDHHLEKLPENDEKSRAILLQMKEDELHHATVALEAGGRQLPDVVKGVMHKTAKVMTSTVYYI